MHFLTFVGADHCYKTRKILPEKTTMFIEFRKFTGFGLLLLLGVLGCGAGSTTTSTGSTGNATMNLVVSDTPPSNVSVLAFQVQITGATLQPGNVSLLPKPVTVDLAQLASDTGFLSSSVIGSATYTSLTLTYANPQITLLNNTTSTLTAAGQSCVAGAVCTFTPALNNASLTVSSGIFPLTVSASSTTGLNMDLSIPDLLQSDLSINFANGSSVNLSLLPNAAQPAAISDILGTVSSVNGSQVNITTAFGDTLVLTGTSSSKFFYPTSLCSAETVSCVSSGQIVSIDAELAMNGGLSIDSLNYVAPSGTQVIKGLVLSENAAASPTTVQILIQRQLNASVVMPGQIATVSLPGSTSFAVGTSAYPAVSGASFANHMDVMTGQELFVLPSQAITSTSFPSSSVYLEPSQVVGRIGSVGSSPQQVTLNTLSGLYTMSKPIVQQVNVNTDASTQYLGYTQSSFGVLTVGSYLSARGPLFAIPGGTPTVGAMQIRSHPSLF